MTVLLCIDMSLSILLNKAITMLHLHDSLCYLNRVNEVVMSTYATANYCTDGATLTLSATDKQGLSKELQDSPGALYKQALIRALLEHTDVVFDCEGSTELAYLFACPSCAGLL